MQSYIFNTQRRRDEPYDKMTVIQNFTAKSERTKELFQEKAIILIIRKSDH